MQKGVSLNTIKNEYLFQETVVYLFLGDLQQNVVQYAAKWRAICRKTQCVLVLNTVHVLVLNARRNGAKRKAKWCKTKGEMPLNARQKA